LKQKRAAILYIANGMQQGRTEVTSTCDHVMSALYRTVPQNVRMQAIHGDVRKARARSGVAEFMAEFIYAHYTHTAARRYGDLDRVAAGLADVFEIERPM